MGQPTLWIPAVLPSLNDLLRESRRSPHAYNALKRRWAVVVGTLAGHQRFEPAGTEWSYLFLEPPGSRRDVSNIVAGAVKFVEDALVDAGHMPDDSRQHVRGITPSVELTDGAPGVFVVTGESLRGLAEFPLERCEAWKKSNDLYLLNKNKSSGSPGRSSTSSRSSPPLSRKLLSWTLSDKAFAEALRRRRRKR